MQVQHVPSFELYENIEELRMKTLSREEEDKFLRDLLVSSACTPEALKEAEEEAPYFRLTKDGVEFSKGWIKHFSIQISDNEIDK